MGQNRGLDGVWQDRGGQNQLLSRNRGMVELPTGKGSYLLRSPHSARVIDRRGYTLASLLRFSHWMLTLRGVWWWMAFPAWPKLQSSDVCQHSSPRNHFMLSVDFQGERGGFWASASNAVAVGELVYPRLANRYRIRDSCLATHGGQRCNSWSSMTKLPIGSPFDSTGSCSPVAQS